MEKNLDNNFFHILSSVQLAFLGDSIYETYVRKELIIQSIFNSKDLSKKADEYTSAVSQAKISEILLPILTEEESKVFNRGRNLKHKSFPKNASVKEYRMATALECVFGYLYLKQNTLRIEELMKIIFDNIPV